MLERGEKKKVSGSENTVGKDLVMKGGGTHLESTGYELKNVGHVLEGGSD